MKHFRSIITILLALFIAYPVVSAQNRVAPTSYMQREWTGAMYGPSYSGMPFSGTNEWTVKNGFSLGFSALHTYWFNPTFGVTSGIRMNYTYIHNDGGGDESIIKSSIRLHNGVRPVDKNATLSAYIESVNVSQSLLMVEIPVLASFKYNNIYCNAGLAFAFPLTSYGEYSYSNIAYRLLEINDLGVSLANQPVETTTMMSGSGNFRLSDYGCPFFVMLAAEAGYRFPFDEKNYLSVGAYGRYALNRQTADGEDQISKRNGPVGMMNNPMGTVLVKDYGYFEVGLRIAYHFGLKPKTTF